MKRRKLRKWVCNLLNGIVVMAVVIGTGAAETYTFTLAFPAMVIAWISLYVLIRWGNLGD